MEAARTSETLVNFYQTTRCYNPEDSNLHTHRRENLKSYLILNKVFIFFIFILKVKDEVSKFLTFSSSLYLRTVFPLYTLYCNAWNENVINWEEPGRKLSGLFYRISLGGLIKTTNDIRQDNRLSGRDMNPGLYKYEAEVLKTRLWRSVKWSWMERQWEFGGRPSWSIWRYHLRTGIEILW
jgi:hypothetical protein